MPNYVDIYLPKEARTSVTTCNCYICLIARFKVHVRVGKGKGHIRDISTTIDVSNGIYASSTKHTYLPKSDQDKNEFKKS